MALRHVRAAQKNTKLSDPIARSIIQVIATDIGHDDSPAYPSYRTIAERAGCHYNTVADKVKALCDNGDLIVTKEGKYNYYTLPYECGDYHTLEGDKNANIVTPQSVTKEELSQELSHLEARLSQRLSQSIDRLSQRLSQIVTAQSVTEVEVKGSKGKGEGSNAPTLTEHPAVDAYIKVTETWPGDDKLPFIVQELGEEPNVDALEKAWMFWIASGYNRHNAVGVAEWYHKIVTNPGWTPGSRFDATSRASPKTNGNHDPRAAEQPESDPANWKPVDEYGATF